MKHIARLLAILIVVTMASVTSIVGVQHKVLANSSTQLSTSSTKWLHVQGTRIVDGSGHQLFLRGAEIESAFNVMKDWQGGTTLNQVLNSTVFNTMVHGWKMNVLRICLSNWIYAQDSVNYLNHLNQVVQEANAAGLYVVLCLHDDGAAGSPYGDNLIMPKAQDLAFWRTIAGHYKNNPMVLFDLLNEPHVVGWSTWLSGHATVDGVPILGHQDLVNGVRAVGAKQIIIVEPGWAGGKSTGWASVGTNTINDPNVMYSLHIYQGIVNDAKLQDTLWGSILNHHPLYYGEWALLPNGSPSHCQGIVPSQADQDVINFLNYMRTRGANWTAWDFRPYHLIQNYTNFAPTTLDIPWVCGQPGHAGMGTLVKNYLTGS